MNADSSPSIPSSHGPGGFIPTHTAPFSPPPSSTSSSIARTTLPHPRTHPLKLGSNKESSFINYVDKAILNISRRYTKKFSGEVAQEPDRGGGSTEVVKGYESFREVARDLERLVDVIWVSGTPSLQIPYLLSLALATTSYLHGFPPAPRNMFRLLRKLDFAFASLLQGRDIDTGDTLPGFESRATRVSTTDKVRIKSLVERTRVAVVEIMRDGEVDEEEEKDDTDVETGDEDNDEIDIDDGFETQESGRWEMEIARVFDRTIVELGETMGEDGVGGRGVRG